MIQSQSILYNYLLIRHKFDSVFLDEQLLCLSDLPPFQSALLDDGLLL